MIDPPGTIFPCAFGRGINETGDIAGAFAIVSTLGECNNRPPTFVYGINDDGVVGIVTDNNGNVHGFKANPEK